MVDFDFVGKFDFHTPYSENKKYSSKSSKISQQVLHYIIMR